MTRHYNFGAGPATISELVLEEAQSELLKWNGQGMSVLECSHRSPAFMALIEEAEQNIRDLLAISDDYAVLFLAAPGRSQYAMVPMNLLRGKQQADYLQTGIWSAMAAKEAQKYCDVNIVASSENENYRLIQPRASWQVNSDAAYFHYVSNETVNGIEIHDVPEVDDLPIVTDMTSNILSKPIDVSKFACIYSGAQKNIGPAGLTLVIVRKDYLGQALPITPTVYDYKINADKHSLYYTPATFSIYLANLTFKWLKQQGGVEAIAAVNQRKSAKLYAAIDESSFYHNSVDVPNRSIMNVIFTLANSDLDKVFLEKAAEHNFAGLKGHRIVGGMRASIYNAMPEAGVDALIAFMKDFEQQNA